MFRTALLLVAAAACGGAEDRPKNLTYITEAILQPTCGAAECHSQYTQQVGDEYDTVESARRTFVSHFQLTTPDPNNCGPSNGTVGQDTMIVTALTRGCASYLGTTQNGKLAIVRMPYDAPMPSEDIQLIVDWINAGASGAQCIPGQGDVCGHNNDAYTCDDDGNLGVFVRLCTTANACTLPGNPVPSSC